MNTIRLTDGQVCNSGRERSDLVVRDGLIADSTDSTDTTETAVDEVDVSSCLITPGLVNAHHHLLQSAFRTLPGTRGVPMADWLKVMADAYRKYSVDPELDHAAAAVGLAESLLCGVTTVADHHLTWPDDAPDATVALASATARAAEDLGARLCFVRGTAGNFAGDPIAVQKSVAAIHEAFTTFDGYRADKLKLAVGPSGVHSDGPDMFAALADVASDLGLLRRTQANEQVDVAVAEERYGLRPLELLSDWGWLAPDVTLAHLCGITEEEVKMVASRGVTVTHAPGCDVPMGWGIAPVAAFLERGVTVGMGTSGGGSNDGGHLLADTRLAVQVSGLTGRPITAHDALRMATVGSAVGLGWAELGVLTPGTPADLCVWDMNDVADAGVHNREAGLLWASPGRRPRDVMVAGRWVVRDYELLTADSHELAADLTSILKQRTK